MELQEAADAPGAHRRTAYAWARQAALPARTAGHRDGAGDGETPTRARRAPGARPDGITVRSWAVQADRLHAALAAGDETEARQVFGRLAPVPRWPSCASS